MHVPTKQNNVVGATIGRPFYVRYSLTILVKKLLTPLTRRGELCSPVFYTVFTNIIEIKRTPPLTCRGRRPRRPVLNTVFANIIGIKVTFPLNW